MKCEVITRLASEIEEEVNRILKKIESSKLKEVQSLSANVGQITVIIFYNE